MGQRTAFGLFLSFIVVATGCGGASTDSTSTATANRANFPPPEATVAEFLEAVRTGKDDKASSLLTPLARKKTTEMSLEVAPPGSETAKYKVGQVEFVADDGAHVASEWIDVDETGAEHSDAIIWMVRLEDNGWRIAGMATKVFEDQPPLFLNFEDPEDMLRKQQLVGEEMERRAQTAGQPGAEQPAGSVTAAPAKGPENPIRR